jgi:hypothetical protein
VAEEKDNQAEAKPGKPSPKLWIVAGVFVASVLVFSLLLGGALTSVSLTLEGFTGYLPVLVCLFLAVSLAIIFSLVSEKLVGLLVSAGSAVVFGLLLTALALPWRLVVAAIFFIGLFYLRSRARKIHEAYTTFGASHYRGVMTTFFLILVLVLAVVAFSWSREFFTQQLTSFQREKIESMVNQAVTGLGEMVGQMTPEAVPEDQLAQAVEEILGQLLGMFGVAPQSDSPATSYAQVTERISNALEESITGATAPYLIYVPFILAGLLILTLGGLAPFVAILGVPVFFAVYQLLLLARVLKLEEVERPVKRLALN